MMCYNTDMEISDAKPVGRFAPTPSGRLHLGNIFAAMLAWLSVRSRGGRCLLRIEDLDTLRCSADDTAQLLDDLEWFGFTFDGETLHQSERAAVYDACLEKLRTHAEIYPCYCSRGQLHAATAPHASDGTPIYDGRCRRLSPDERPDRPACLRIAVPDETIRFVDGVQGAYAQDLAAECGDFILRRSDGVYAYQLAVVADDGYSGVTEVVRGRDLLGSAPRQLYLCRLLGFPPPVYYHVPLLLGENGERLSKRDGCSNLAWLRAHFSTPEPILGLLAYHAGLLSRAEPVSLNELIPLFDWEKVPKNDIPLNDNELLG